MLQVVVFSINQQRFALPIDRIDMVILMVEVTPLPNQSEQLLGVVDIHEEIVPVYNTRKLLGLPPKEIELQDKLLIGLFCGKKGALWIDEVLEIAKMEASELLPYGESGDENIEGVIRKDQMTLLYSWDKLIAGVSYA